jgi:hypothetical protein
MADEIPTPAAPATPAAGTPPPSGNALLDAAKAAPAAPAAPAAAPDPAKAGPDPAKAAAPYYPEGLPEDLKGKDERETLDKLWKAEQARARPPAKAEDYKLELPKDLEGVVDPANDKVLPIWRAVAHKHGLTQAQYQAAIVDLYAGMQKAGVIDPGVNVRSELEAIGGGGGDKQTQYQRGVARVLAVVDQVKAIGTRNGMAEGEVNALVRSLDNRTSLAAVEKLLALIPAERGVQAGGQGGGGPNLNDPAERARLMYPNTPVRNAS